VKLAIADAISDADLFALGEACAALPLITGGSGIALGLPENFRRAGLLPARTDAARSPARAWSWRGAGGQRIACHQRPGGALDRAEAPRPADRSAASGAWRHGRGDALAFAGNHDEPVLIYATAQPDEVKAVQAELGVARAGELVEHALAASPPASRHAARGASWWPAANLRCRGAGAGRAVAAHRPQIAPGVPATVTLDDAPLGLALKSGNFGGENFFDEALQALGAPQ
jgi:uncharacterized protein YgbK (DUF1537 family)